MDFSIEGGENMSRKSHGILGGASDKRELNKSKIALAPVVAILLFSLTFAQKKDSCTDCHSMLEGPLGEPVGLMKTDIHKSKGLSCADCHGGDASIDDPGGAMDPRKGFIAKPKPAAIPGFCGKCHSNADFIKKFNPAQRVDQETEFLTSIHGKLLKQGDQKVATCISCHGNHGVRAVADPKAPVFATNVAETCSKCHSKPDYMAGYMIPHDQYDKYRKSVHARALYERQDKSAPTCNSCHGNHGATPPGVASIANVCGQCHVRQSTLFQASPHKGVFDAMGIGECIQCHNNHEIAHPDDEMIGAGANSTCTKCHVEGDAGFIAATKMRSRLDELVLANTRALDILERAERAGMQVSKAKFELNEAKDSLTNARVLIHSFAPDEVDKVISPGIEIALKSYNAGESAMNEMGFRRKGLAVSLFFILLLAGLVYLKIRQIESVAK